MKRLLSFLFLACCSLATAAETIPVKPPHYFNDYAHVTQPAMAGELNKKLEDFEKQTSSQIVLAVYPKMESDSALEDYTVRVFRAWGVGQANKNNGAVLFVFVQDHKMRIATGYGLEGALPDALCKRILDDEITPWFKKGDYQAGLSAGVTAMIAAAKGEYKGTGRTVAQSKPKYVSRHDIPWGEIIFVLLLLVSILSRSRSGRGGGGFGGWMISSGGFGGWSGGGGGWSGGGGGGGGGGGFSGGGGSTGGGGASGSW